MVYTSEVSLSQVYEDTIHESLFHSPFSSCKLVCNDDHRGVGRLSLVSLAQSIAASIAYPYSITTVLVSPKFGVLWGKSYRG